MFEPLTYELVRDELAAVAKSFDDRYHAIAKEPMCTLPESARWRLLELLWRIERELLNRAEERTQP